MEASRLPANHLAPGACTPQHARRPLFAVTSLACGLAPGDAPLIAARAAQGTGAALLVPGSLALIDALIAPADQGRAVGAWAGLSGVASAAGPRLGGWLVQAASWRWAFFISLPLAAAAVYVTARHIPESRETSSHGHLDWPGACLAAVRTRATSVGSAPGECWRARARLVIVVIAIAAMPTNAGLGRDVAEQAGPDASPDPFRGPLDASGSALPWMASAPNPQAVTTPLPGPHRKGIPMPYR